MIVALLAAFQLAAATPSAGAFVVRDASRSVSVPLTYSSSGPLVRPEALRPVVPITVSHLTGDRWLLIVGGSTIEVEEGVRFARVGDVAFQLARPPEVRKGALYVPLQLVVELVPRIAELFPPGRLSAIATSRPTLADVFAKLTGKGLAS